MGKLPPGLAKFQAGKKGTPAPKGKPEMDSKKMMMAEKAMTMKAGKKGK